MRGTRGESDSVTPPAELPVRLASEQLIERLEVLAKEHSGGALAFDGDGTLWVGDVGEDVFHALLFERGLKDAAAEPLRAFASQYQLETHGTPEEVALRIFQAYLAEDVPEREVCELMAWCFAGWSRSEIEIFVSRVLIERGLNGRRIAESNHVLDWARQAGLRCLLISASPHSVVEVAGGLYGFATDDIHGIRTEVLDEVIQPRVIEPSTYGLGKARTGRSVLGDVPWLAAFGDSGFDAAMMRESQLGVGVRPKGTLLAELGQLPHAVILLES
ncbi:MAG: haloacid dehalogenase-like hydrolase [Polyangiaceae bacterium]|nr:haloacid dehalogenase-like hydrolase [Myxococcales bacterium]MCB9584187.1 haloacid dehalogenase-like hydrolase [Polyangiaceae bacterium]MCB9608651.1 haloacid dehalogenase-like hydrolase [Polyangiaceae bacterium]